MDDAAFVRVGQRCGDLAQNANRIAHGEFTVAREPGAQRLTLDERHRKIRQAVRITRREQRHDVRMLQSRGKHDFALEALDRHLPHHVGG